MPYSLDLRTRVVESVKNGMSRSKASMIFRVSRRAIYNWLLLNETTGSLAPKFGYQRGHSHAIMDYSAFQNFIDANPDQTQQEIAQHFEIGQSSVSRALIKIGYSRKKKPDVFRK